MPQLLREVIRSHYINISHPDMTRVVVKVTLAMREPQIFTCTVYVEYRVNITSDSYFYKQMGNASIIANITGECVHDCCMHSICMKLHLFPQLLANPPTSMSAKLVYPVLGSPGLPPSPSPAGYEVFYQAHGGGNRISRGTTSKTYHDLNGLPLGSHSVFFVAFGAEKDTVLPSAHSDMAIIIIGIMVHACMFAMP